ncbi:hypothetical protein KEM52_002523 [Ascosphaera acerosa]|nr:hypothetical protein KEM52_002523 [Ascosphaera acerosa]
MWTLYAAGLDPRKFSVTEAALVQNTWPDPSSFPRMIWSTNYTRLACQVLFTLFWAGRDFAPRAIINGVNIQDYLQDHFVNACRYLAQRIHDAGDGLEGEVVVAWETLNEPNRGLIGQRDLAQNPDEQKLNLGTAPTAWQAILTGAGRSCTIATYEFGAFGPYQAGTRVVDPKGQTAWLSADYDDSHYGWKRDPGWRLGECIWAQHGVWDPTTDTLLRKDYFAHDPRTGQAYGYNSFTDTYLLEHVRKYKAALRSVHRDCIIFVEPPILEVPPLLKDTEDDDPNIAHAIHYYDGLTLMTKHWNRWYNVDVIGVMRGKYLSPALALKLGEAAIRNGMRDQLRFLREESLARMGNHPAVFTEFGIPYDMDGRQAYRTGDYSMQVRALDANSFAIEGSGAQGANLWNYTSRNCHEWGDMWNGEDLSIVSRDDPVLLARDLPARGDGTDPPASGSDGVAATAASSSDSSMGSVAEVPPTPKRQCATTAETGAGLRPRTSADAAGKASPNGNYRAAEAFIRPSPRATHGRVVSYGFDLDKKVFTLVVRAETPTPEAAPTVCYLPQYHFPEPHVSVTVSGDGRWSITQELIGEGGAALQLLHWWHARGEQRLTVRGAFRGKDGRVMPSDDGNTCASSGCAVM